MFGGGIVLHFLSSVHSHFLYLPHDRPHGSQDDGGFAGVVGGLERGGASDCALSDLTLEGFACWEGALGGAGGAWPT